MNAFKLNKTDGFYYAPPIGPTEKLDYELDLVRELDGDTIATAAWARTPTGITIDSDSIDGTKIIVRLKDALAGFGPWIISAHVTSGSGQLIDVYFKIAVRAQ